MGIGMPRKSKSNERMVVSAIFDKFEGLQTGSGVALPTTVSRGQTREEGTDQQRHEQPKRRI